MDRGFCQYLTEHDNSNDEAEENNTLDDFEALMISINDAQEPEPVRRRRSRPRKNVLPAQTIADILIYLQTD